MSFARRAGVVLAVVAGCSSEHRFTPIDGPVDAPPDPFDVVAITPTEVDEAVGADGGRPALFVLAGSGITEDATVTVELVPPTSAAPTVTDVGVSADGRYAGVGVAMPVMPDLDAGQLATMRVTVSQDGATRMFDVAINGLDELDLDAPAALTQARYSRITVSGNVHFPPGAMPVRLEATGGIVLDGTLDVDASGTAGGPGACGGGPSGTSGGCGEGGGARGASAAQLGTNTGSGGGGGGFGTPGMNGSGIGPGSRGEPTGGPLLLPLATVAGTAGNRGNGGGSGGTGLLDAAGGAGGGGGGVLALWAGGEVRVGSNGGARAAGGNGTVANGSGGGGGSGGAIFVRAGGPIVASTSWLSAPGGAGGATGSNSGGNGGLGRIRVDAAAGDVGGFATMPPPLRGPTWSSTTPLLATGAPFVAQVRGGAGWTYTIELNGAVLGATDALPASEAFDVELPLDPGRNVVCVLAEETDASPESRSCIAVFGR